MFGYFSHRLPLLIQPKTLGILLILFGEHLAFTGSFAQGCAMCQTVMPGGSDPMAQGLFWGVLILLVAPFLVVGIIGGWLYYHSRSARRLSSTAQMRLIPLQDHAQDLK